MGKKQRVKTVYRIGTRTFKTFDEWWTEVEKLKVK
jgi:hypothetical protein